MTLWKNSRSYDVLVLPLNSYQIPSWLNSSDTEEITIHINVGACSQSPIHGFCRTRLWSQSRESNGHEDWILQDGGRELEFGRTLARLEIRDGAGQNQHQRCGLDKEDGSLNWQIRTVTGNLICGWNPRFNELARVVPWPMYSLEMCSKGGHQILEPASLSQAVLAVQSGWNTCAVVSIVIQAQEVEF
jgi:hypothetical protein